MMLGANSSFLERRCLELNRFVEKISHPPSNKQMWKIPIQQRRIEKGDCFWYKHKKEIYGALVIEIQKDTECSYNLIVLTEQLNYEPKTAKEMIEAPIYTLAWFEDEDLLTERRMHFIDNVSINSSYKNRYGLKIQKERSIYLSNCGQLCTWLHRYRVFSFQNQLIRDFLEMGDKGRGTVCERGHGDGSVVPTQGQGDGSVVPTPKDEN